MARGYARVFNSISRELIGLPLTRKQQDEIRAQRPKLSPEEIDKNGYRHPAIRERASQPRGLRRAFPRTANFYVACAAQAIERSD
jgi:hypothetical protein